MKAKTEIDLYTAGILRKKREEKGWSQQKLSDLSGYSKGFINNIEQTKKDTKLSVNHINLFSEIFECSPKDFMPDKPFLEK
jgi:transcriptional regulator with XRE-family HTH domain